MRSLANLLELILDAWNALFDWLDGWKYTKALVYILLFLILASGFPLLFVYFNTYK